MPANLPHYLTLESEVSFSVPVSLLSLPRVNHCLCDPYINVHGGEINGRFAQDGQDTRGYLPARP